MNGHMQPGQVVTVKAISAMVGSSVMPAREAMTQLIAEGALELRSNRSVIVPVITRAEFDEVTELRCHIEGLAAHHALAALDSVQLLRLEHHEAGMRSAAVSGDRDAYLNSNFEFHFGMYRAGASPFVLSIVEKLWMRVGPLIGQTFNEQGFSDSSDQHGRIVSAIKVGDARALRAAVQDDIEAAARMIRARNFEVDLPGVVTRAGAA